MRKPSGQPSQLTSHTYACFNHGPKRQPDGINMVYGSTCLDDSDYGKYDDYKAQRENRRQCHFLLSIDL